MTFRVDSLSTLFTLVITGVGTLIHLYSIGYMGHDETPGKFFAYLNLFCFAMLVLVLGGSLPLMFLGWEGVGLCSYLLIGYWYTDDRKGQSRKKGLHRQPRGRLRFSSRDVSDFHDVSTLDFAQLAHTVRSQGLAGRRRRSVRSRRSACFSLWAAWVSPRRSRFMSGCLTRWRARRLFPHLIHAATMVTSGIYLVSRLNFLYSLSPTALSVVAGIGVFTAFFAATIAIVQTDIKKILAYSTVSQLGYMFLGCGVGAYSAGVFHVITHAFFKALMFLGAGSVIHGMHEEQDILKMGGLKKYMPKTYLTFMMGWLAICGIPPFSGFFSKDEILWQAFSSPTWIVAVLGTGRS